MVMGGFLFCFLDLLFWNATSSLFYNTGVNCIRATESSFFFRQAGDNSSLFPLLPVFISLRRKKTLYQLECV